MLLFETQFIAVCDAEGCGVREVYYSGNSFMNGELRKLFKPGHWAEVDGLNYCPKHKVDVIIDESISRRIRP